MSPKTDKIDEFSKELELKIERGVIGWVNNDQWFNWLRNTAARWVLAVLTLAVLYGFGLFAWINEGVYGYLYPVTIFVVVVLQKLSVRFVFDDDSVIDEYQHERRNRAYRRAYKRIGLAVSLVVVLLLARSADLRHISFSAQSAFWPLPNGTFSAQFSVEQLVIGLEFLIGLFALQKYLSWGMRGERN